MIEMKIAIRKTTLAHQQLKSTVKNAKKKIIQIRKTTLAHQQLKSTVKNAIKETDKAVLAGNKSLADKSLKKAIKALDNAKVKGLVHKNKVDREKSRLTKKVNTMEVK
jgi:small subunit ribosomal protein S20